MRRTGVGFSHKCYTRRTVTAHPLRSVQSAPAALRLGGPTVDERTGGTAVTSTGSNRADQSTGFIRLQGGPDRYLSETNAVTGVRVSDSLAKFVHRSPGPVCGAGASRTPVRTRLYRANGLW